MYVFQNSILSNNSNIYRKSLHRIMMMIGKNDLLKGLFFDDAPCNIECLLFHNGCNRTRIYCGIMCRQSGHFATCSSSSTHSCSNALFRPWFNPTPPLPASYIASPTIFCAAVSLFKGFLLLRSADVCYQANAHAAGNNIIGAGYTICAPCAKLGK